MTPLVTVLMPVYNGAAYLRSSIESVLAQTFKDFELLIIDDGSTDTSEPIYSAMAAADSRIRFFKKTNGGISSALNKGLELARGIFIARTDSDDIMLPQRIERQYEFLQSNPGLGFCSSAMEVIDKDGVVKAVYHPVPSSKAELDALLHDRAGITFTHPTVMMRRSLAVGLQGYNKIFEPCEDTDLFCRMIASGATGFALPEVLMQYRMHSGSISGRSAFRQICMSELVRVNLYRMIEGKSTLTPSEWNLALKRRPLISRLHSRAFMMSAALRQTARYDRVSGDLIKYNAKIAGAIVLRPVFAVKAALKKIPLGSARRDAAPRPRWS
jgi:glycosyltransferase involved in cell wall biosynthesis